MSKWSIISNIYRRSFILVIAAICLTCSCDSNTSYPVVVFSDVHFSPFYDSSLFQSLNSHDANQWSGIFEGSIITEPATYGDDSNYPLLTLALSSIQKNLGTSRVVIFTGDVLGHDFAETFFRLYESRDVSAMEAFASKTLTFFTQLVKSYVGDIPVMFVLGNADSYTGLAPDSAYFENTAEIYYSNWIGDTADHQAFLDTYEAGGYYSAEPLGSGLMVIALNTVALSTLVIEDNSAQVDAELTWLDERLGSARNAGQKVWLLMHVPPGAYIGATAEDLDPSGHLSSASMMLKPDHQRRLLQILSNYSDIITMMLAGHTHMDEFRNIYEGATLSAQGSLEITPGITPYFDNDPAYKIYTFTSDSFEITNYSSLYYDLTTDPLQFNSYYTFSTAYFNGQMQGLLNDALTELYPLLNTNVTKQGLYRDYYYSGSSASSAITDANWKVYWCGMIKMVELDLIDCVNSL